MKKLSLLIAMLALFSTAVQAEVLRERGRVRANDVNNPQVVVVNPDSEDEDSSDTADADDSDDEDEKPTAVFVGGANSGNEVNVNQNHTKRNAAGAAKHKKNPTHTSN